METLIPAALRSMCALGPFLAQVAGSRRWPLPLALIGALLVSTLGAPIDVGAVGTPPNKPAARVQVVVKSVKVHDDREGFTSGDGEMLLWVGIWRCTNGLPTCQSASPEGVPRAMPGSVSSMAEPLARSGIFFNAGTGDTVTLGDVIPGKGEMWGAGTTPDYGFPVYPGQHYVVQFDMEEMDETDVVNSGLNEYMGWAYQHITLDDLALGEHSIRSLNSEGDHPGDYTITYDVRMVAAADLRPGSMKIDPVAGTNKSRVCISVFNAGTVASDPMYIAVKVDGTVPAGGRVDAATLGAGENGVSCVDVVLPTSGQHTLTGVVDAASTVNEYNELNNEIEQTYQSAGPTAAATPTPTPTPSSAKAEEIRTSDLSVTSIKVNGQEPDGKSDCKEGKNKVVVVVKNGGMAVASKVAVRLVVDGARGDAQTIATLAPGDTTEVRFDDVRLKKGKHTLTAVVQAPGADADEDGDVLKVTAACMAAD